MIHPSSSTTTATATDVLEDLALALEEDKLHEYDLIPSFVPVEMYDEGDKRETDPQEEHSASGVTAQRHDGERHDEEKKKTSSVQWWHQDGNAATQSVGGEGRRHHKNHEGGGGGGGDMGEEEESEKSEVFHDEGSRLYPTQTFSISSAEPFPSLISRPSKDLHRHAAAAPPPPPPPTQVEKTTEEKEKKNATAHLAGANDTHEKSVPSFMTPSDSTQTTAGPMNEDTLASTASGGLQKPMFSSTPLNHSTIMLIRQDGSFYSLAETILDHDLDNDEVDESVRQLLEEDDVVVVCNEKCSCNDKVNLADRFQVLHDLPLGQGTFGSVYRAWDSQAGCYLAAKEVPLKLMSNHGIGGLPAMKMMGGGGGEGGARGLGLAGLALDQPAGSPRISEALREFTVLTSLDHPRIVKVVAFMVRGKVGCIFMEWMPWGSLLEVIRRYQQKYQEKMKQRPPPRSPQAQAQTQDEPHHVTGEAAGSSRDRSLHLITNVSATPTLSDEHHPQPVIAHDHHLSERVHTPSPDSVSNDVFSGLDNDGGDGETVWLLGLEERFVQRYARDTLEGLAYLHSRRVLHRDIKPANLLLASDGSVKLTDFGTSHVFGDDVGGGDGLSATLETSSIMGTVAYLAPEAVKGVYSSASDVWALGCTVVELLTGVPPWCDLVTHHHPGNIPLLFKIGSLDEERNRERPHTAFLATPQAKTLSPELKDFLNKIFVTDRHARPSAKALLDHPFMKLDLLKAEKE